VPEQQVPEQQEPEQQEPEQQESFLLATRNALEQALGKEALEAHERLLAKERECTDQYIVNLEEAVKQQYGTPVVHDILIQNQIAILKVKAEGQDESARTEIKLLRDSNTKLADEKTTLGRCVQHLTDENINLKRQDEAARAEIQILHENNTKLTEENSALVRNIKALKDEHNIAKVKAQEEATRTQIKILRENNVKLTEEKNALVRSVKLLKGDNQLLQANISALTQEVCDQKKLNEKRQHEPVGSIKDAKRKNKKLRQKLEKQNKRLMKENTKLSRKVVQLETGNPAEV
jgi:cell division protein FtsB